MKQRFSWLPSSLSFWHLVSVIWLLVVLTIGALTSFRAVKNSGMAQLFQLDDVPLLWYLKINYGTFVWSGVALGVLFLVAMVALRRRFQGGNGSLDANPPKIEFPRTAHGIWLLICVALFVGIGLFECRYHFAPNTGRLDVPSAEPMAWALVALVAVIAWLMTCVIPAATGEQDSPGRANPGGRVPLGTRLGVTYLLGGASVLIYALWEHREFWNPEANGGYIYAPFFREGEAADANVILYSTSILFATIIALVGVVGYVSLWLASRSGRRTKSPMTVVDCRRQALLAAMLWTATLGVPWQIKILGEINAEKGWILPALLLVFCLAALWPMAMVSSLMLKRDFDSARQADRARKGAAASNDYPRRSELAFWTLLLFPVYPYIRWLGGWTARWRYLFLMGTAAVMIGGLTWLFIWLEYLFDFDDWRGMLETAQFPFLRVMMSLLGAYFTYLVVRSVWIRLGIWTKRLRRNSGPADNDGEPLSPEGHEAAREFPNPTRGVRLVGRLARAMILLLVLAALVGASWPFWGWRGISKNTFARTFEFSDRHEFELLFLHWVFDFDRDGYSSVLHGADPDDFDRYMIPGYTTPIEPKEIPDDWFEIQHADRAREFPNLMILYLEGVVPRAISAYGQRQLPDGLQATRHIDSVAAEGTIFRQARCIYPSTWDSWVAVNSGRFMRTISLDVSLSYKGRYTRFNNMYKVLRLAGVDRWCHADTNPYYTLSVPDDFHAPDDPPWQSGDQFDSNVTGEEFQRGVTRGDKRAQRIVDFLDDIKPGEKFFACEHFNDTHFPWERTPLERAKELGFPEGIRPYEADARLPNGQKHDRISRYYHTITRTDAQIGQILDKLKERGLYDNTMIVFVGDHGCQWWEHEHCYYVAHLYEQCIRVPMIVRIPGVPSGGIRDEPVLQTDILATVMEWAGVVQADPSEAYPLNSNSLLPLMQDRASGSAGGERVRALVDRLWNRDVVLLTHYDMFGVLHNARYKLIFDRPSGTYFLFDIVEDPEELVNLADDRPKLLEEMLGRLAELLQRHPSVAGGVFPEEGG